MDIFTDPPEVPIGLGIALCKNPAAMQRYTSMTVGQKRAVIAHTHTVDSTKEMDAFVEALAEGQIIQ